MFSGVACYTNASCANISPHIQTYNLWYITALPQSWMVLLCSCIGGNWPVCWGKGHEEEIIWRSWQRNQFSCKNLNSCFAIKLQNTVLAKHLRLPFATMAEVHQLLLEVMVCVYLKNEYPPCNFKRIQIRPHKHQIILPVLHSLARSTEGKNRFAFY